MKKFYSFALIILSLFSCVFFSACGDKYKNLKIDVYSSSGALLEHARFVIDDANVGLSETLSINFKNINEEDVGQIVVYSIPNNLISVSNYTYSGNECFVEITPEMSSEKNAKLIVSHLASGKRKQIPLTIDQKSTNVEIIQDGYSLRDKYVVSIPESDKVTHNLDLTKIYELQPSGSTDEIFFKLDSSYNVRNDNTIVGLDGVKLIPLKDVDGFEKVYTGLEVSKSTAETLNASSALKIYPVTFLNGFNLEQEVDNQDQYQNKTVSIYFKKTLNESNVILTSETEIDKDNIQLIANDDKLNSFRLSLTYLAETEEGQVEVPVFDKEDKNNFFDMYELEFLSEDSTKVSALADANNDIIVTAYFYTEQPITVTITLKPINFVGDIKPVELTIKVKGELKSEKISVSKNGESISTNDINIFDYYETGTSHGALFRFNSGENVHEDIGKMRILVKPAILCAENNTGTLPEDVTVNSMLYSLMFNLVDDYLKFTYDETLEMMVSEEIDNSTIVYIKYVYGEGDIESKEFVAKVQTYNKSTLEHWSELENVEITLDFNTLKGIKSMELQAGYYHIEEGNGVHTIYPGPENVEKIYLNRLEGLDNTDENVYTNFIYVADTVKDAEEDFIESVVELDVTVESLNGAQNPLKLYNKELEKDNGENDVEGVSSLTYKYSKNVTNDVIGLVYRKNTTLGEYKITFKQEAVVKAVLICKVYENLAEVKSEYVSFETNNNAFKNNEYPQYQADYIVASGQELDLSIALPQTVLNSDVIQGYEFSYQIGVKDANNLTPIDGDVSEYFEISHNNEKATSAELKFKKGTFIGEMPQYVYVTLSVLNKTHETIVSEETLASPSPSIEISFFIYETIFKEDIRINETDIVRHPENFLAVDYKHLSKLNLEINMDAELWNYTTNESANRVDWTIDGKKLEFNEINDDGEEYYDGEGVIVTNDLGLSNCEFVFDTLVGLDSAVRIIKAYVTQFNNTFEFQCVVYVEKPIITERLIIESETYVTDNETQTPYINLKVGEKYQVLAQNISSLGDVTNPEIVIQVTDEYGSAPNAKRFFDINQTTSEITVKSIGDTNRFKLVVFAKDAIKESISQDKSGYNMPSNFLMEEYSNAYLIVDIYLSDGSEENPYLIKDAYDFWEINDSDNELLKHAHYQIMTSISLDNVKDAEIISVIDGFSGSISTFDNAIYSIDGIYLDKNMKNLFTNFNGEISNVKFSVNYAYDINSDEDQYLGLIGENLGILTNVSVYVRGYANLNGEATYYFGSLVGENKSTIQYKSGIEEIDGKDVEWIGVVGVDGLIELNGNADVYFGGLVGKNVASIIGCENTITIGGENEIILNMSDGRENTLSKLSINSEVADESAVGGVVGLNTYSTDVGTIHNAFVQVIINSETTSNVGGVVGKNQQEKTSFAINRTDNGVVVENDVLSTIDNVYKSKAIYNVKSASRIKALNNVGGIVGLDINGIYLECDYQILTTDYKETALVANSSVGGIAGNSNSGIFAFCSVMSYEWNYAALKGDLSTVITNVPDILAEDNVGGIVGYSISASTVLSYGNNSILDKTVIVSSSVNAYLKSEDNIGGILSSSGGHAVLFNVYFIGKLEGSIVYNEVVVEPNTHYFVLDNNQSSDFNAAYSLNLETASGVTTLKTGNILNDRDFIINSTTNIQNYWWWNANVNGGYIFITKDENGTENSLPIFDLAPDSIDVQVVSPKAEGLERVLMLDYYDFSIAENANEAILLDLIERTNRNQYIYKLDGLNNNIGLLNIVAQPATLGAVVINIKSTNSNVVDITYDGRILINGIGECELIFSSVLNPNAGDISLRTIKVVVDYPIDNLHLSTSKTDSSKYVEHGSTQNIGQGSGKQYYAVTNGVYSYREVNYQYKTKSNLSFKVEVNYETSDVGFDIEQYLAITGNKKAGSTKTKYIVDIDNETPFMVSVLKMLESGTFKFKVTPYVMVGENQVEETPIEFELSTLEGVTNVSFSYDDAIVYPNDVVYLNAYLSTDHKLNWKDIFNRINIISNNSNYTYTLKNDKQNIIDYELDIEYIINNGATQIGSFVVYIDDSNNLNNNVQKIKFRIEFKDINTVSELDFELHFELGRDVYEAVNYTILPQRINKIEIKNYYYRNVKDGELELVQQDVLKPNSAGEMIIDIVPDNGYYDYLEISDITGNEEIVFIQVDKDGNALSLSHDPSSDGKGIKLYDYNLGKSRIYVKTQISNKYSSKIHTVEVRAYSAEGVLLASSKKYIDVKMLPEIEVTYQLPDGRNDKIAGNALNAVVDGVYLANGVDARFVIKTRNANTDVETTITAQKWDAVGNKFVNDSDFANNYELINISNDLYTLKSRVHNDNNIGKKLKLTFKVYSLMDNGDYDVAQCSMEFTIASFVVHGVSVNSSIDDVESSKIYGYYNREIDLEFYFDKHDISFYDITAEGEYFHDTVYRFDKDYKLKYDNTSYLYQINSILESLNSCDASGNNEYLILNNDEKEELNTNKYKDVSSSNINLKSNKLTVLPDYSPKYLAVAFMLNYSKTTLKWSITNYDGIKSTEGYYIVDKNYYLEFINATKWYEPTVINSKTDFENMVSGGSYILNIDLTDDNALTNYKPIDANIVEFDGNGHTIEIESFAQFNDVSIKAGLFAQIYPNMIVKNVKVKYVSTNENGNYSFGYVNKDNKGIEYFDICNNSELVYTDAQFGGIAAVNNGVITNCYVEGIIAVNASTLESTTLATGGNYEIKFNLGGLVAENSSTGYITNCSTQLNIFAQANIGGFVHTNNGKIVSCGVEENTTIYGYNVNLPKTIIVDIAGFAVDNSSEISMSYVNLIKKSTILEIVDGVEIHEGTMSAKDFSAGFVSRNNGTIYDAYVQISENGVNNNRFAGFVDTNSGEISRAYSFINSGIKASKDDLMFVGENTGNLNDCIEFVVEKNKIQIEGLNSVDISLRNDKAAYEQYSFAFGDNISAVWTIQAGTLPKLVSTQETKFEDFKALTIKELEDNVDDETDKFEYEVEFENYGTKQNPYIIHNIETWNYYFDTKYNQYMTGYYRLVRDIDFTSVGNNPKTCKITFSGNIQGNNMDLSGIMLYLPIEKDKEEKTLSFGLFGKLEGSKDKSVENSVRNLTLSATSVWASSVQAVGILAGIIEDFNLYNITIDAEGLIIVGANAVGGVAGLIRGELDMDQIRSNVGANSTRASTLNNYSIYMSRNNGSAISYNLPRVYYAGSVAGILDGYDRVNYSVNDIRNIDRNYNKVQNIIVDGNVSLSGDTVGGAFGFVGEQVLVNKLTVNISGSLFGAQYSGGAIGENRGVLINSTITLDDNMFKKSQYVSAGAVGFNLGGLVEQVEVKANIIKQDYLQTSGGVIGRNVNGVIRNAHYDGEIVAYFAGGIVGVNYNKQILMDATTGTGALHGECKINSNLIPKEQVEFYHNEQLIKNFENVSISINAFNKIIENSKSFYSYRNDEATNNSTLQSITVKSKVLGVVAGLSYDSSIVDKTDNVFDMNYNIQNNKIIFNVSPSAGVELVELVEDVLLKDDAKDINDVKFTFENVNVLDIDVESAHVIYLVGAVNKTFDSWANYSNEYLLVK